MDKNKKQKPEYWTVAQLKEELTKNNVQYETYHKKAVLLKLYKTFLSKKNNATPSEAVNDIASLRRELDELKQMIRERNSETSLTSQQQQTPIQGQVSPNNRTWQTVTDDVLTGIEGGHPVRTDPNNSCLRDVNMLALHAMGGSSQNQRVASDDVPFVETVPPSGRQAILQGKDVNLAQLLINDVSSHQSSNNTNNTGNINVSVEVNPEKNKDARLNRKLSIQEFITAFAIYKNVLCEVYPERRKELDTYEREIVEMYSRFGGSAFYEYHKAFSARAAELFQSYGIPIDWARRDTRLFCSIFAGLRAQLCSHCNSAEHSSNFCAFAARPNNVPGNQKSSKRGFQRSSGPDFDKKGRMRIASPYGEICNNFNFTHCIRGPSCNLAHICSQCQSPTHKAVSCPTAHNNVLAHKSKGSVDEQKYAQSNAHSANSSNVVAKRPANIPVSKA